MVIVVNATIVPISRNLCIIEKLLHLKKLLKKTFDLQSSSSFISPMNNSDSIGRTKGGRFSFEVVGIR